MSVASTDLPEGDRPPAATHTVGVAVTTLWVRPDSPRPVDAPITLDRPDAVAWLAALDEHDTDDESGDGRLGLHGRVESQLLAGEPVVVVGSDASGRWAHVVAPWQRSPKDERGYPGWVPSAHLTPAAEQEPAEPPARPADLSDLLGDTGERDEGDHPAVVLARRHLGLRYLWCGISPLGFDCSGLVLHTWRQLGHVVARDAYAQAEVAEPVALDAVRSGDLYFFARPGRRIHHVGIVVRPGRMVHASETGGVLVEEDLPPERVATLVAAGRLPHP
ncbi:C40 family peptidase [Humibacillus xanthopallidus]|uniref:NlpC/P60 family protein n=1 Tax=Humibacillus xanthopallidus TaxID=412689 RepID=A0A543HIW8_9MICO|nr:NlpC/P60 family protein [Humibacillus xanthopallidus]TQM58244.1 NlpC/P60 family protein [Humibacillus xanthopallidus]